MSDRHEQARAEAERRYPAYPEFDQDDRDHTNAMRYIFLGGVEWADVNPQPHTITRSGYEHANRMFGIGPAATRQFLRRLGIEVEDDDE